MTEERAHKPDLMIQFGATVAYADVVITDAGAPSHLLAAQGVLGAAEKAARGKWRKYRDFLRGARFFPFSLEAAGGYGKEASKLITWITEQARLSDSATMTSADLKRLLRHGIACAVQRGNAGIMHQWLATADVLVQPDWHAEALEEEEQQQQEPQPAMEAQAEAAAAMADAAAELLL